MHPTTPLPRLLAELFSTGPRPTPRLREAHHSAHPATRQPLLTPPLPTEGFSVIVSFEDQFSRFYEDGVTLVLTPEEEGSESFANQLASLDPDEGVVMAIEALRGMISHGAEFHGISYGDIARLRRHSDVRAILYDGGQRDVYIPKPSPTEEYHLQLFQEHIASTVEERFNLSYRHERDAYPDTVIWRLLVGLILEISAAVSAAGAELGISESALLSYQFKGGDTYGTVAYAYVLYLQH